MPGAKETTMDAALATVLPELDLIYTLKEQRTALKAFLGVKHVSALLPRVLQEFS